MTSSSDMTMIMSMKNYPGAKGKCYQRLINLMPPHSTYIESHLGSGKVLLNKRSAQKNIGIDIDGAVIEHWRQHNPDRCTLVHGDAAEYLAQYPFLGTELVYSDPPYVKSTRQRQDIYRHDYSDADHERLIRTLKSLPCSVMLSGYPSAMYHDYLANWRKVTYSVKTHIGIREECVWMNFPEVAKLHDGFYLGATFRERQTIRRRQHRLLDRFEKMDSIERNHVLQLLNQQYGETRSAS